MIDRALLQLKIDKLLAAPSNLEIKEDGRIFIKSLHKYYSNRNSITVKVQNDKGLVMNTFDSLADCAKHLSISPSLAGRKLRDQTPTLFNGELVYIKRKN